MPTKPNNAVRLARTDALEHWLMFDLDIAPRGRITPAMVEKSLTEDISECKSKVAEKGLELQEFQDIKALKAFLKTYRIPEPFDFMGDGYF